MDDKEIDTAKMQVQGQLAAQYIQDVMQARAPRVRAAAVSGARAAEHRRARALCRGRKSRTNATPSA